MEQIPPSDKAKGEKLKVLVLNWNVRVDYLSVHMASESEGNQKTMVKTNVCCAANCH